MVIKNNEVKILEAGCDNGRILRYYHSQGYKIIGFYFIEDAINIFLLIARKNYLHMLIH